MEIKLPYKVACLNCGAVVLTDMELECGAKELEEPKFFDSGCLSEELL